MASGPHLWKCSRIRSSLTLSGRLPTQRCRVSLTILHPTTTDNPHYNPGLLRRAAAAAGPRGKSPSPYTNKLLCLGGKENYDEDTVDMFFAQHTTAFL